MILESELRWRNVCFHFLIQQENKRIKIEIFEKASNSYQVIERLNI